MQTLIKNVNIVNPFEELKTNQNVLMCRGASGQAVANANLMLGLEERSGLPFAPLIP